MSQPAKGDGQSVGTLMSWPGTTSEPLGITYPLAPLLEKMVSNNQALVHYPHVYIYIYMHACVYIYIYILCIHTYVYMFTVRG